MPFPNLFTLDAEHLFEKGLPERVCGNTALMLGKTRLAEYFDISGDFSHHFGPSGCGTSVYNRVDPDAAGQLGIESPIDTEQRSL